MQDLKSTRWYELSGHINYKHIITIVYQNGEEKKVSFIANFNNISEKMIEAAGTEVFKIKDWRSDGRYTADDALKELGYERKN